MERTKYHQLLTMITIALCAVICGADTWVDVEEFGNAKRAWLETFLELPNGIPSHDTFGCVFARLNPEQFQACFLSWVQAINGVLPSQQIVIDGKTTRRSHERAVGKAVIQMVSVWAQARHLVLAQRHMESLYVHLRCACTLSSRMSSIPMMSAGFVLWLPLRHHAGSS